MAAPSPDALILSLLLVALVGTGVGLLSLLRGLSPRMHWVRFLSPGVVLVFGGFGVLGWAQNHHWIEWLPSVLLAGLWAVLPMAASPRAHAVMMSMARFFGRPVVQGCLLLAAGPAMTAFTATALQDHLERGTADTLGPYQAPIHLTASGEYLLTDAGSKVPLFRGMSEDAEGLNGHEDGLLGQSGVFESVIRTGPADESYNCHGWVFAAGRGWVKGGEVDRILRENGYQIVTNPQVDDLAIYRKVGADGVSHSGIVRAASPNGLVLIESKWGQAGRFVHLVQLPFYPGSTQFYRRPKTGHALRSASTDAQQRAM